MTHSSVWIEQSAVNRFVAGSNPAGSATIPLGEINAKDVNTILGITKMEAFDMRKLGFGNYVKKSYSSNPHYYLVEDSRVMKAYQNYKKSKIVK